ncbi:MAG: hypothetical protein ABW219_15215 [Ilumatobacteraceae bacterium]
MSATTMRTPSTEAVALDGAEVVQAAFEHAGSRGETFLPAGLVPTNPTLVTLLAIRVTDGPQGPFTLAQVRVSCRSGARARALVVATAVDAAPEVRAWLADGWGIGGSAGPVDLRRHYDRVRVVAPWFVVELTAPRPIGADDVQYVTGLHPVAVADGDRLAQVELEVAPHRVERGRPQLHSFTAPDGAPGLRPTTPVAATSAVATFTLPAIRFVLAPDRPAHLGTERVRPA